jgi:hypothetical protein
VIPPFFLACSDKCFQIVKARADMGERCKPRHTLNDLLLPIPLINSDLIQLETKSKLIKWDQRE